MDFKTTLSFIVIVLLIGISQTGTAEEKNVVYKLYGYAPKGTKMRPVEATSTIPFNKRYNQLSEKHLKIYRADFEGLKASDVPPYPKKGLKEIYWPLIKGHKRVGGKGELLVFTEINEKGDVNKVAVYKSPSKEVTELATAVMFNTKFKPASCDGEPCAMQFPFYYDMPKRVKQIRTLNKQDFDSKE